MKAIFLFSITLVSALCAQDDAGDQRELRRLITAVQNMYDAQTTGRAQWCHGVDGVPSEQRKAFCRSMVIGQVPRGPLDCVSHNQLMDLLDNTLDADASVRRVLLTDPKVWEAFLICRRKQEAPKRRYVVSK